MQYHNEYEQIILNCMILTDACKVLFSQMLFIY